MTVVLTTVGVYLLDRVKLRASLIDPADCAAQPQRYRFLVEHQTLGRALALACALGGAIAGIDLTRWAPLAVVAGVVAVVLYAPGPRQAFRVRPKDLFLVKSAYTARGLAGFVAAAGAVTAAGADRLPAWWRPIDSRAALCAAGLGDGHAARLRRRPARAAGVGPRFRRPALPRRGGRRHALDLLLLSSAGLHARAARQERRLTSFRLGYGTSAEAGLFAIDGTSWLAEGPFREGPTGV